MTLPSLETASFWANVAVVVLTVLAALSGAFALYFSMKVSTVKDVAFDRFKVESATAISLADARAAEANRMAKAIEHDNLTLRGQVANLEIQATTDNERALKLESDNLKLQATVATLEKETAVARERQAGAERLLAEVSKRMGPRLLNIPVFREAMKGKPKGKCEIVYWPNDSEAQEYSLQFLRWLGAGIDGDGAGWEVLDPKPMAKDLRLPNLPMEVQLGSSMIHLEASGISLIIPSTYKGDDTTAVGALVTALMKSGISFAYRVEPSFPKDAVTIVVGPKP